MEIKGIKDGILVTLDQQDWLDAKNKLLSQIESNGSFFQGAKLFLDVGSMVLRAKEMGELCDSLAKQDVVLSGVLSLSLVTQATAQRLGLITIFEKPKPKKTEKVLPIDTILSGEPAVLVHRTMRSGFKVAYDGHVVVLGDVNPGAEILASGSVIVWGRLKGTVHAGAEGDEKAVVCALDLSPMQLRIASKIAISPPNEMKPAPEIARIKDNQIIAELWAN